ncbi:hypothetical protein FC093_15255 [Ilyomonas limi]|uniref:Uncharacterized protein n=1 Tax=Ilyomonas limi TaxID=2575867 RepID=A0A4U3KXE2_9BACT|nr:hypothetical protein [Ilyomonas limi]TKK67238.1 hypothetical protein FC093_15255 [Ilyomonas limi]
MLKSKMPQWIIAILYVVLFVWIWMHSKEPALSDVPLLFGAGLVVSLLCLIPFNTKANQVLMVINIVLLIANIVMYFAAYRLVSGVFKN